MEGVTAGWAMMRPADLGDHLGIYLLEGEGMREGFHHGR